MQLNPVDRTVRIPRDVRLDLGSTAKALAADRAAARVAASIGDGAFVSLGGDVAVAGRAPVGGWPIGIAQESRHRPLWSTRSWLSATGGWRAPPSRLGRGTPAGAPSTTSSIREPETVQRRIGPWCPLLAPAASKQTW